MVLDPINLVSNMERIGLVESGTKRKQTMVYSFPCREYGRYS